jgi:hypothetical protein
LRCFILSWYHCAKTARDCKWTLNTAISRYLGRQTYTHIKLQYPGIGLRIFWDKCYTATLEIGFCMYGNTHKDMQQLSHKIMSIY